MNYDGNSTAKMFKNNNDIEKKVLFFSPVENINAFMNTIQFNLR